MNIEVFNKLEQVVLTLTDEVYPAGTHAVELNANQLAAITYFFRISVKDKQSLVTTRGMLLVK